MGNAKKGPFGVRISGYLWDIIHGNLVEDLKDILRLQLLTSTVNVTLRSRFCNGIRRMTWQPVTDRR